jgi:serine/threonine protein kinase/tetratricopeptide (TPR) repeat protein
MSDESRVQQLLEEMFDSGRSPEEACIDCPELLDEVCRRWQQIRMVESDLHAMFPTAGTQDVDPSGLNLPGEGPGTRIGPYKLLQQIGEGGFGVVYMAEQDRPVHRRVALKIIKPGMDSAQVIARFEAERQALALMDHQNIAKVHDAGTTDNGRPFFVMELVNGLPITRYCDENNLTVRERLALMASVCRAVQHAHQKGIIHRDLKPSNVLVCLYDPGAPGVPKVIDFGVAKAIDSISTRLTERTMITHYGQIIGTFEYMSPEQAEASPLGVDTRSDIYSLGVMLYELLTGSTPLPPQRLRAAGMNEMLKMIKEEEPPKPSTRLSSTKEAAQIAAARRTESLKLNRLLRGELDWVVMKCLEKDRARRYDTATGLARDIERYLHDEPVEAGPPGAGYRLRKLARKHRAALGVASLIAVLLVMAAGVSTWLAVRATRERDRAEANEKTAKDREAETRAVLNFVENKVFGAARPDSLRNGLGTQVTLRRAVEKALPFVEESFHEQPLVEARLRMTLGRSFWYLAEPRIAADQYRSAREIYAAHLGPDHPDTLRSMNRLASIYYDLGQRAEALKLREETLGLCKAKLGPDHPDTLESMDSLAGSYANLGRHTEALKLQEETLAVRQAKLGADHADTLMSMNNLANRYYDLGRYAEACKLHEETLALRKAKLGPDNLDRLNSMNDLANAYSKLGRHTEALKLYEETLAIQKAKLAPDHPITLLSMNNLAFCYFASGRYAEARKLNEETLALRKAKLGFDHPDTLMSMNDLANAYLYLGQPAAALKLQEETLVLRKAKLGPDHPDTLMSMYNIACIYARMISKAADRDKQTDVAMDSLKNAIAAGFKDLALLKKDTDIDALRDREDFKKLVADLEAKLAKEKK